MKLIATTVISGETYVSTHEGPTPMLAGPTPESAKVVNRSGVVNAVNAAFSSALNLALNSGGQFDSVAVVVEY